MQINNLRGIVKEIGRKNKDSNSNIYQEIVIEKNVVDEFGDVKFKSNYAITLINCKCPKVEDKVSVKGYIRSNKFHSNDGKEYWSTSINCKSIEVFE